MFSTITNRLPKLDVTFETAKVSIAGKYHSFVNWTATNSLDVREKLAITEQDGTVKKTIKVALTILASLFLTIPSILNVGFQSVKELFCKKPVEKKVDGNQLP